MTTVSLIKTFKQLLGYDLEVPHDLSTSTVPTDAEVLDMLNDAQDEIAGKINLYQTDIAVTIPANTTRVGMEDVTVFARRMRNIQRITLNGSTYIPAPIDQMGTGVITGVFTNGYELVVPSSPIAVLGTAEGQYMPSLLMMTSSSELPRELASRLARYAVSINADAFATEGQQVERLRNMGGDMLARVEEFKRRTGTARFGVSKPNTVECRL